MVSPYQYIRKFKRVGRIYKSLYDKAIRLFHPKVQGLLDFLCRPDFNHCPPLNSQERRQELFEELFKINFNAAVETGTYIGATTEYLARHYNIPVYTAEKVSRFYYYSRFKFRNKKNINVFYSDSRVFLKKLSDDSSFPKQRVLFYLDAHRNEDVPLKEEVGIINESWSESVIIIDDFQVADDTGYGFDNYGKGRVFCLGLFEQREISNFEVFWPAAKSTGETGLRRGCVVFVTKDKILGEIKQVKSLRQITG